MKQEDIKRANQLEDEIKKCNVQITLWENIYEVGSVEGNFKGSVSNYSRAIAKHIPLSIMKAVSLEGFREELKNLEAELASL